MSFPRSSSQRCSVHVLPNAWDVPSALATHLAEGFHSYQQPVSGSRGGHPGGHRAAAAPASHWRPPWHRCNVTSASTSESSRPDAIADYVAQLSTAGINIEQ